MPGQRRRLLKTLGRRVYNLEILKPREEDDGDGGEVGGGGGGKADDDLYDRAVQVVCSTRNASISWVQRQLRIGYNRAARLVEEAASTTPTSARSWSPRVAGQEA